MGVQSQKEQADRANARNDYEAGGFTIKDSGQRAQFASGMVRDVQDGKADVELIFNGPMADRWAEHLTKGAKKYPDTRPGVPNWTLAAGEEELVRFRKSAARHFRQWLRGDTDEDHAAAAIFNINGYEYVKEKMVAEPRAQEVSPKLRQEVKAVAAELYDREPVRMHGRTVMLPTPQEVLRRIQAMESEDQ